MLKAWGLELREVLASQHDRLRYWRDSPASEGLSNLATALFSLNSSSGYRFTPVVTWSGKTLFVVEGEITCPAGRSIGEFNRRIVVEDDSVAVYHNGFYLAPGHTGKGVGAEWTRVCEARYSALGSAKIRLVAGDEAGGYVWAKLGYEFADKEAAADMVHTRIGMLATTLGLEGYARDTGPMCLPTSHQRELRRLLCCRELQRSLASMYAASAAGAPPAASAVAEFGPGQVTSIGKALLLGTSWPAVKDL